MKERTRSADGFSSTDKISHVLRGGNRYSLADLLTWFCFRWTPPAQTARRFVRDGIFKRDLSLFFERLQISAHIKCHTPALLILLCFFFWRGGCSSVPTAVTSAGNGSIYASGQIGKSCTLSDFSRFHFLPTVG